MLTVSEVAALADVTRATARRILLTLRETGYVREQGGRYSLSPKVLDLGYSYLSSLDVSEAIQSDLARLATEVDLPCSVSVLDGDDLVIVNITQGRTSRLLRFNTHVGTRLPAYPGAMGRVLLGSLSDSDLEAYLARVRIEPLTEFTVRDRDGLRRAIAVARAQGWCVVDRERDLGVISLAVPLVGRFGQTVAALNVSIHAGTMSAADMVRDVLPRLRESQVAMNERLRTH
jgi:IclR family pca regulon transcriptional regulator